MLRSGHSTCDERNIGEHRSQNSRDNLFRDVELGTDFRACKPRIAQANSFGAGCRQRVGMKLLVPKRTEFARTTCRELFKEVDLLTERGAGVRGQYPRRTSCRPRYRCAHDLSRSDSRVELDAISPPRASAMRTGKLCSRMSSFNGSSLRHWSAITTFASPRSGLSLREHG